MQQFRVTVDYNGIVLFGPDALVRYFGGAIREGENILKRLTTTDDGEAVIVRDGVFPMKVARRLVIADLAVLAEWTDDLGWQTVHIAPGDYGVTVLRLSSNRKVPGGALRV